MKRLLLPLLAALSIYLLPLMLKWLNYNLLGMAVRKCYVVPMQSLEACGVAGQKFADAKAGFRRQETMTPLTYVWINAK